jgi:TM2 domain-containing membrane protein YozV
MSIALQLLIILLVISPLRSQTANIDFNSPANIRLFADHLYCEKDYLRAVFEYDRLLELQKNDTLFFKIGLSYSYMYDYPSAAQRFDLIPPASPFFNQSRMEWFKVKFLMGDYPEFKSAYNNQFVGEENNYQREGQKLFNFSYLFTDEPLPSKEEFLSPFEINEKVKVSSYYDWKNDPPYKSSTVAGIMSAIIPGSGKVYVGEVSDGIVAFLVTGIFVFLAYDNFQAGHTTRAWIFTGAAALFYGGNIYGSVAAAQVHNAKITFEFNESLNIYLKKNNYYSPVYDFCN